MMLRMTRQQEPPARATLKLEGSVAGDWAALLERECEGLLLMWDAVSLDLTGVRFVDQAGVETLGRLDRAGVELRCPHGAVASMLEAEGVRVTFVPGGGWC